MIIFYNRKTGDIGGYISGRVNSEKELNMWIGDKKKDKRLLVQWRIAEDSTKKEWEPDHPQKKIFRDIEKNKRKIFDYKVDTKTKKLIDTKTNIS